MNHIYLIKSHFWVTYIHQTTQLTVSPRFKTICWRKRPLWGLWLAAIAFVPNLITLDVQETLSERSNSHMALKRVVLLSTEMQARVLKPKPVGTGSGVWTLEKMFEWRVFSCYFTANLNGKIRQLILVSILFDLFHPFVCLFVCFFFFGVLFSRSFFSVASL